MVQATELRTIVDRQRQCAQRWWRRRPALVALDAGVHAAVAAPCSDAVSMSTALVDYFWRAHQHYLHSHGTLAYYPGWPSIYGATSDAVEGVSRPAPLWAAYVASPFADPAQAAAMQASLLRSLLHGTDPAHPGYWGDIGDRSTLICEAADIALALWLARESLWPQLSVAERGRAIAWLRQAVGKRTADNNWHLFVVLIDAVLATLDPAHRFSSDERLARVRAFARPDGCFVDGPAGQIDLYNAWGFHYLLFWLGEIDASRLDPGLSGSLAEFCRWYQWLFTDRGLPLFGRSLCYRFAACAPLLACAQRDPQIVAPGVALAAYQANWRFFVAAGGLRAGRPTQGVFGEDERWLDPYSGPASSLWGTRSMVMFFHTAHHCGWDRVLPLPLPAQTTDCSFAVPGLGARVTTNAADGTSVLEFLHDANTTVPPRVVPPTARDRVRAIIYGSASRPANNLLTAGVRSFSSLLNLYR